MKANIFHKAEYLLAEAPYWCPQNNTLYWVDILNSTFFSKTLDGWFTQYMLPEALTSFFIRKSKVYGCTETGYCEFDLETKKFRRLIEIEKDISSNRSNDGKHDGSNGFIFGTMNWNGDRKAGNIYYVDTVNLDYKVLDNEYFIPNGFAFNSNFSEIAIADSYLGKVYKYDYSAEHKELKNKREIVDVSGSGFSPDGMVSTGDGKFWNAQWDGACINLYDFYGQLLHNISLSALRPTSCVFGGLHQDQLFITTAIEGLSEQQIEDYPCSGSILSIDMSEYFDRC